MANVLHTVCIYEYTYTHTQRIFTGKSSIIIGLCCDAQKATSLKYLSDVLMFVAINILRICVKTRLKRECSFECSHTSSGLLRLYHIHRLVNALVKSCPPIVMV